MGTSYVNDVVVFCVSAFHFVVRSSACSLHPRFGRVPRCSNIQVYASCAFLSSFIRVTRCCKFNVRIPCAFHLFSIWYVPSAFQSRSTFIYCSRLRYIRALSSFQLHSALFQLSGVAFRSRFIRGPYLGLGRPILELGVQNQGLDVQSEVLRAQLLFVHTQFDLDVRILGMDYPHAPLGWF